MCPPSVVCSMAPPRSSAITRTFRAREPGPSSASPSRRPRGPGLATRSCRPRRPASTPRRRPSAGTPSAHQAATQLPHRDDLVFTTRQGKTTNLQNLRARVLYPALDRANAYLAAEGRPALPKIVLHGLRHSNITTLRSLGVAGISVQKHAGHGSERMTDHYTHLDERRRIAQLLDTAHRAAVSAPEPAAGVMRALGGHTCGFSGGDHGCLEWPPAGIVPPTRATLFVCMVATRWGSRPDTK
jgi:hypothetical protein